MGYAVLGAWLVQAAVGTMLLVGWARHARGAAAGSVLSHAMLMVGFLVPWSLFIASGSPFWAWAAVAVLFVGIPFGDAMMVGRSRSIRGETNPGLRDYGSAVGTVFSGLMPPKVTFHALFSAVVFFGSVALAVVATIGAAAGGPV
ncbi:hypothetical protein AB0N59_07900 [Microbacterium sp. NPDC089321]|uniref:hypothetical protein n=1 Tax=Microbacterium sp. NPDC089321 TaxID=3155183 RepID=UPI00342041AA